ncbi:MAG: UDP-N-acetylglucosamine 2-epimerase (non-hydrolyzing) [Candidatus Sericytochromatia bacterium]|nr:UDP-N-acetylglucosamine 2-epimerase (non-hydrolyzing) [Candidatus Sericytochromatia bacterium]
MKLLTVVGARPQFIKAAVVSRALARLEASVREVLVHTGQHYDPNMSEVFFTELDLAAPDHHLGVGGGTHGQNTGRMLERLEAVMLAERPDRVLVYGDTDSTIAGALAAAKLHIPVAHVEAGLRSYNRRMPEEQNRVLTDHLADQLFAPTRVAVENLAKEGIAGPGVRLVGDVMYDGALHYAAKAERESTILADHGLEAGGYVLATLHRQENADDARRLRELVEALGRSPLPVVWPLHPRTRQRLAAFGLALPPTVRSLEPVGYLDMVRLEQHAAVIVTDSGGVQKEAYFHGVPCITLRPETEWVELVACGANELLTDDLADRLPARIAARAGERVGQDGHRPYGDGTAGEQIARAMLEAAQST